MRDIDLLVAPRTFQTAERVLLKNGWRRVVPSFPVTPARNRWYGRFRHEHVLAGPGGLLDLHRRLSHNPFYIDVPFESLLAGSVQVEIGAHSFRTLGQEDDLVYLMCHGARHYWKRLVWLCDVAVVLASMEPERLERVSARCRQAGLSSILASTLLLCGAALHVRLPRGAAPLPAGGRRAAWIARFSERTWCDEDAARFSGGLDWIGRIALARALMRRPTLLVLDEATGQLDAENERRILEALESLRGRTTVVTIAHRPALLEAADGIVRLESGRVAATGSWRELAAGIMAIGDGDGRTHVEGKGRRW